MTLQEQYLAAVEAWEDLAPETEDLSLSPEERNALVAKCNALSDEITRLIEILGPDEVEDLNYQRWE